MVQAESQRSCSSRTLRASISVATGLSMTGALAAESRVRKRLEIVDRVEDSRDGLALGFRQLGPPDVEQQDDSQITGRIACLMLDAVVEDQHPAFLPLAGLVADAQPAALGNDQRQVTDQAAIEHAVMGRDVRARL